ncbi:NAD(P)/FAD-dependent oxidoreductase [Marininema halotolerans]|uniref:NADH dehydrogenase n=1 Tax=Marininema halotolerans TaxID=1155944 RepID=A0A1I6PS64_9BACL|nr:NAD(P)/FAD-dependent oxidoreductase [Marininema halotolerans]SFS43016.1 NADH dehydrogenase [Marininema halotolerans]
MGLPKIVVLGAGFGGLMTVRGLQKQLNHQEAEITLVNLNPYHYVTTQLHEPAAGTLDPDHTRVALESLINRDKVRLIQDKVTGFDPKEKVVRLAGTDEPLAYDYLVFALGAHTETFGTKGVFENALLINNLNSVRMIREHIEYNFARYQASDVKNEDLLKIVIGGAGFTSIEFVGELVDRLPYLCKEFDIPREKVQLINIEAAPTVMPGFDKELVDYAVNYLSGKGVNFRIGTPIQEITEDGVILKGGEEVKAATVVWNCGVRGNALLEESGLETMRGRIKVDEFLRAPGYEDLFIIGDNSLVFNNEERPYPPTAQMAMQQGQHLAKNMVAMLRGGEMKPYRYAPKGTVASLGRNVGIGTIGNNNKKVFGRKASLIKKLIDARWFFILGGFSLALKKAKF